MRRLNSRPSTAGCLPSGRKKRVESQVGELAEIAKGNGDVIVERYLDDGYSGELLARPALDRLRNDARRGLFSKVYILSPDRLARKHHYAAIILEDLGRHGIKVVFANRPPR
jgi:site-specific DNA recombinase